MTAPLSERDLIELNAYLDGELSAVEREAFERRLSQDATLRAEMESLRATIALLGMAGRVPVPRNFTLDPRVYGRPVRPVWWQIIPPVFIGAGALAAVAAICGGVVLLMGGIGGMAAAPVAAPVPQAAEVAPGEPEAMAQQEAPAPAEEPAMDTLATGATVEEEAPAAMAPVAPATATVVAEEAAPSGAAAAGRGAEGAEAGAPGPPSAPTQPSVGEQYAAPSAESSPTPTAEAQVAAPPETQAEQVSGGRAGPTATTETPVRVPAGETSEGIPSWVLPVAVIAIGGCAVLLITVGLALRARRW